MSSTGDTKPESKMAGIIKANAPRIACCWLAQTEEMNKPTPTNESRAMKEEKINNGKEPVKGISKKKTAALILIFQGCCSLTSRKSAVSGSVRMIYETWCFANTRREITASIPKKTNAVGIAHTAYSIPLFICSTDKSETACT